MILDYLDHLKPQGPQVHITEEYVSSPPAVVIVDEVGAHWALGLQMGAPDSKFKERYSVRPDAPRGEFSFDVLRNGCPTGEFASRIERRKGKIRIFTRTGWKVWSGHSFI